MKKLSLIAILAVVFTLSVVFSVQAKIYHFEINSVPYAAYYKADGTLDAFEVPAEYHAKFKSQVPQKSIARQKAPKKATSQVFTGNIQREYSAPVIEVPAQEMKKGKEANTPNHQYRKFAKTWPTRGEYFGEGLELQAIDAWAAKAEKANSHRQVATEKVSPGAVNASQRANIVGSPERKNIPAHRVEAKSGLPDKKISPAPSMHHSAPEKGLTESRERDYPAVDGNGHWTVSRKKYIAYEKDLNGIPIVRERIVTKKAWTNLNKGGDVKKGFIWVPGQIMPPDWMVDVGGRLTGIDPETGQVCEMEIPVGYAVNFDSRGNSASIVGKFSSVPKDRYLLGKNTKGKEEKPHV